MFIRVRDKTTKHEFDVPEDDWRIAAELFTPIKSDRFPPVDRPRAPKHYTPKGGTAKQPESASGDKAS